MPMQCPCNAMQSTRGTVHSRSQIDTCYWRSKILVRIHIVTRAESSASLRYECEWSDSIARPNRPVGTGIRQEVSIVIWPASGSGLGSGQGSGDVADQADFEQINVGASRSCARSVHNSHRRCMMSLGNPFGIWAKWRRTREPFLHQPLRLPLLDNTMHTAVSVFVCAAVIIISAASGYHSQPDSAGPQTYTFYGSMTLSSIIAIIAQGEALLPVLLVAYGLYAIASFFTIWATIRDLRNESIMMALLIERLRTASSAGLPTSLDDLPADIIRMHIWPIMVRMMGRYAQTARSRTHKCLYPTYPRC